MGDVRSRLERVPVRKEGKGMCTMPPRMSEDTDMLSSDSSAPELGLLDGTRGINLSFIAS